MNVEPPPFERGDLEAFLAREVVQPCIALAFEPSELHRCETVAVVRPSDGAIVEVVLSLETVVGDAQSFWVWQSDVPGLATVEGMQRNLLMQLEEWLPESQLRWGQDIRPL